ncbi:MAG: copper homeostasis protein CutC [Bacteroidaceae bacterium]|nr:copper homeostasis protein CutC [Bacteroidaceae bacterium]
MDFKLEICCADLHSLRAAVAGGAHRVELCQALDMDGLTPSAGMIEMAVNSGIDVHILIRPRGGNFVYSEDEVDCMIYDIQMARKLGAQGVVIGALTPDGDVDIQACHRMVEAAGDKMHITFHRAFDVCRNPEKALLEIHALGCDRLLTSGQAPTAEQGIPLLKKLVAEAKEFDTRKGCGVRGNILRIMPGAGVMPQNAARIIKETGATEIHSSLRKNGFTDAVMVHDVISRVSSTVG